MGQKKASRDDLEAKGQRKYSLGQLDAIEGNLS